MTVSPISVSGDSDGKIPDKGNLGSAAAQRTVGEDEGDASDGVLTLKGCRLASVSVLTTSGCTVRGMQVVARHTDGDVKVLVDAGRLRVYLAAILAAASHEQGEQQYGDPGQHSM